jgi:predicted  nucleic acid-binding Zn-ribbon protein
MPDAFLCSKDLGDLLAETLVGKVDVDELCGRAAGHGEWLRKYAKAKAVDLSMPRGLFDLGKFAETDRRDWNREIKQQEALLADLEGAYTPIDGHGNPLEHTALEACQQALDRCREKRGALNEELKASQGIDSLAALQAEEIALTEQVAKTEAAGKQADIDAGAVFQARQDASTEQNTQTSYRNQHQHDVSLLRQALEAIIDSENCPTCRQACGPEVWDRLRQEKQDELCAKEADTERLETAWQAAHDALVASHEAEKAAKTKAQQLSGELHTLRRKLGEVQGQLARFAGVRPTGDIEGDIATVQEQITKGEKTVAALQELRKRHDCEAYIEAHSAEVQHLDWAVTALRDGELLKGSMHDELAAFRDRLNLELEPHGYSIDVQAEGKSMQFLLTCPGQGPRPVALCSTGNRALAAAAVALAFADHGVPVMLDNTNHLDFANRARLLGRLRERATGTVLNACAWQQGLSDMSPVAKALAPATVYWVEGGAIRQVSKEIKQEAT